MTDTSVFTVGGTVQANKNGLYLSRQADKDLLKLCRDSTFAYILTPRQMGKSSLMMQTARKLLEEERQAAIIDLSQIGTQLSAGEWYSDFLSLLANQLELSIDVRQWWQTEAQSGVTLRLTRFFEEVVLTEVSEPIVIFVDEIDTTLSLDFTDDFFAAIRYLYGARSKNPQLRRLSFVLIGVATPTDLIRDNNRTPFNIGQRVDLADFTFEEVSPLVKKLGIVSGTETIENNKQIVDWVWSWTEGHPYLTQRLCLALIKDADHSYWTQEDIDQVVENTFFGQMSEQDSNLQFVRDRLTNKAPYPLRKSILKLYRSIYQGRKPVLDETQDPAKAHLKLSGVVRQDGQHLQVRNRIYRKVFDRAWIRKQLPESSELLTAVSTLARYEGWINWFKKNIVFGNIILIALAGYTGVNLFNRFDLGRKPYEFLSREKLYPERKIKKNEMDKKVCREANFYKSKLAEWPIDEYNISPLGLKYMKRDREVYPVFRWACHYRITKKSSENPVTENPISENPVTENPISENPVTENPISENPVTENPVTGELNLDQTLPSDSAAPPSLTGSKANSLEIYTGLSLDEFVCDPEKLDEKDDSEKIEGAKATYHNHKDHNSWYCSNPNATFGVNPNNDFN